MRFAIPGDGCWGWRGCKSMHGYGRIRLSRKLEVKAHRLSYALHYGRDPGELDVCHTCDNPECTNPAHLFLGTHLDNMRDCAAKGRRDNKRASRNRGEKNGMSLLSDADCANILALYAESDMTQRDIGRRYGVSQATISQIVTGARRSTVLYGPTEPDGRP